MSIVQALRQETSNVESLPGNVFNLIIESDVLSHIRHMIMMAHNNKSFSLRVYLKFEDDNRMHWLEETFYSQPDVANIAEALLEQHGTKNPYFSDELTNIKNEINNFDIIKNPALSVLFPAV